MSPTNAGSAEKTAHQVKGVKKNDFATTFELPKRDL